MKFILRTRHFRCSNNFLNCAFIVLKKKYTINEEMYEQMTDEINKANENLV